ncbi:hypothetical protein [Wielerella bovis]|uniref:hypothetical protein n=1 Tax=Wielerella bovis TaxID=2917790 RepID=UPI002019414A|nr:hypothetical protein [Wielerella bovis]ULJ59730.1 hypothetical protein MIS44_08585 [Wielerella bovis]ULJ67918.1 hypothetical protein MIS31_05095 [Wielerella bovis]
MAKWKGQKMMTFLCALPSLIVAFEMLCLINARQWRWFDGLPYLYVSIFGAAVAGVVVMLGTGIDQLLLMSPFVRDVAMSKFAMDFALACYFGSRAWRIRKIRMWRKWLR